eukprot:TRINITY_DN14449_c0_g1_i1.p1 TRINITY_DN14449_c0_g1~~TRINITY_DN14449_c0_g1_i1.p1  ORF type:complete len:302 (+),score=128.00 TRINITY_DN14449_c0_g1_i1:186-1091(+)
MAWAQVGVISWSAAVLGVACWRVSEKIEEEEEEAPLLLGDRHSDAAVVEVDDTVAWSLPIIASIGLLLMYFFSSFMFWVVLATYTILACYAVPFVARPLVGQYRVTAQIFAILLVALWLGSGHWLLHDLLTGSVVVTALCFLRPKAVGIAMKLLLLLTVYDVFWVFYSDRFFGQGVMVSVATTHRGYLNSPGAFVFPVAPGHFSLLGAGDIVFPGLVVASLLAFEKEQDMSYELTSLAVFGFIVGMIVCNYALNVTMHGQPALLYLAPAVIIPPVTYAACAGGYDLDRLMYGSNDGYDELL